MLLLSIVDPEYERPIKKKIVRETSSAGNSVLSIILVCFEKSAPAMAIVESAKSESLENLSPKKAPHRTAPTVMPAGMSMLADMPRNAVPSVPQVSHDDPVRADIAEQIISTEGRNSLDDISLSPLTTRNGTVPQSTQEAIKAPMRSSRAAGNA